MPPEEPVHLPGQKGSDQETPAWAWVSAAWRESRAQSKERQPRHRGLGEPFIHAARVGARVRLCGQRRPRSHLLGLLFLEVPHFLAEYTGAGLVLAEGGLPVLVVVHGLLCQK